MRQNDHSFRKCNLLELKVIRYIYRFREVMLHRSVSRVIFLGTEMFGPMMTLQLNMSENSRVECTLKFRLNLLLHIRQRVQYLRSCSISCFRREILSATQMM